MRMLNIGCGATYHQDWVNLDLVPASKDVLKHDIATPLPFASDSFDACYSSHVLEHLRREEADFVVREQHRVLRRGGILRAVVPDLETICRNYLKYLDELTTGNTGSEFRYDYSRLELFDQMARDRSGGELGELWMSPEIEDLEYVVTRHGQEAADIIQRAQSQHDKLGAGSMTKLLGAARKGGLKALSTAARALSAEIFVRIVLGKKGVSSLREGVFRNSGEIHRTMFDKYSLRRLLERHGFRQTAVCRADESRIPGFSGYELDVEDGVVRKPDSLFMEAVKE